MKPLRAEKLGSTPRERPQGLCRRFSRIGFDQHVIKRFPAMESEHATVYLLTSVVVASLRRRPMHPLFDGALGSLRSCYRAAMLPIAAIGICEPGHVPLSKPEGKVAKVENDLLIYLAFAIRT